MIDYTSSNTLNSAFILKYLCLIIASLRFCASNPHYVNRTYSISNSNTSSAVSSSVSLQSTNSATELITDKKRPNENNDNLIDITENLSHTTIIQASSLKNVQSANILNEKQLNYQHKNQDAKENHQENDVNLLNTHSGPESFSGNKLLRLRKLNSIAVLKTDKNDNHEIWAKMTRKMLESVLKKAILSSTLANKPKPDIHINDDDLFDEKNKNQHLPVKMTSTLKRSNDLKINISKYMDKKSIELLGKISGTNIEHNCNNINKHGVVINTNG